VHYQARILHSPDPYYAAASLAPHQQVIFNFGEEPFRYPPRLQFTSFHENIQKLNKKVDKSNHFQGATINSAIISINSHNTFGPVNQNHQTIAEKGPNHRIEWYQQ